MLGRFYIKYFYTTTPTIIIVLVIIICLLLVLLLFLPQIPSPSLQLFPDLQCRHLLNSLIVGRVDGGDTLDVEGGVRAGEVLPGDRPVETERVGLDHLAPPHHTCLYGVGHCLKAGHLTQGNWLRLHSVF